MKPLLSWLAISWSTVIATFPYKHILDRIYGNIDILLTSHIHLDFNQQKLLITLQNKYGVYAEVSTNSCYCVTMI